MTWHTGRRTAQPLAQRTLLAGALGNTTCEISPVLLLSLLSLPGLLLLWLPLWSLSLPRYKHTEKKRWHCWCPRMTNGLTSRFQSSNRRLNIVLRQAIARCTVSQQRGCSSFYVMLIKWKLTFRTNCLEKKKPLQRALKIQLSLLALALAISR